MNVGSAVAGGFRKVRKKIRGASDQPGLGSLLELTFVNAAGDALVTVALAGSLFLSLSPGEARPKVALYLLTTVAPFALLAPVIGPLLDKFSYGRRMSMAATCLARGLLAWQLANAVSQKGSIAIYPLALGLLVLSRGFGVARSAVIPRVTPPELTLVKVNSRMSFVNIVAGLVVAPLGLAIAHIPGVGYPWMLRACALVYLIGTLLSFNLPSNVDSAAGERRVQDLARLEGDGAATGRGGRLRRALGALPVALRGACALRALVGFLTIYMAFLLKSNGGTNAWLAALGASAGIGSGLGVVIGGRLGRRKPEALLLIAMVVAGGGCIGAAVTYTRLTSLLATLLAMMAGSMGKLALDAVVQRDIPEDTRSSAFARSETALQLAWVLGGAAGLIEMAGRLGFSLATAAVAVALVTEVGALRSLRRRRNRFRAGAGAGAGAASAGPVNDGQTAPQGVIPTTGA